MPKIVDHDKKRQEIALKSAHIFIEYGYKNVGMRQLCEQLKMSKSAVYHYYKSKHALFKASTEAIVNFDALALTKQPLAIDATPEQQVENFIVIFQQIAPRFFKEMQLVTDYIEVIGEDNVAQDPCMIVANQKYLHLLAKYVSADANSNLYTLLLGLLSNQVMSGKTLETDYIAKLVKCHLS